MRECDFYIDLLARRVTDKISLKDEEQLTRHLKHCKECKKYQQILFDIQQSMHADTYIPVEPSPAIARSIREKIRAGRREPLFSLMDRIFMHKIPVYQAAFGAVLVAVILTLSTGDKNTAPVSAPVKPRTPAAEIDFYTTQQTLDLLQHQNVGINVSTDSVLMRFVNTML